MWKPTGKSQSAGEGSQQVEARRWKMEASRGLPASSVNDNDSDNDTNDNDSDNGNYNRRYPLPCMLELPIA